MNIQLIYYNRSLGEGETKTLILLDSALGKISSGKHLLTIPEQVTLLSQAEKAAKRFQRFPNEELKKLSEYPWPGNVRELKHFIERAVILSDGQRISLSGLDHVPVLRDFGEPAGLIPLAEMERDYLEKVLNATHWKVSGRNGAAAILGLKPTTLFFRMKKLGLRK